MNHKEATLIIRQRTHPRLWDYCFLTTRSHLKAFFNFRDLLHEQGGPIRLLDLGCGQKPFERFLKNLPMEKYVGVDFDSSRSKPDVVSPIDHLPLEDQSFNAIIASEVLEHTLHLDQAVRELRRVAKPGALVYISTPFLFIEHGRPYDFQRITRYKYFNLFEEDEILFFGETNTNLATIFFLANVAWEATPLKKIPILTPFFYGFNNSLALLSEAAARMIKSFGSFVFQGQRKTFESILQQSFFSMPGGFHAIIKIKK